MLIIGIIILVLTSILIQIGFILPSLLQISNSTINVISIVVSLIGYPLGLLCLIWGIIRKTKGSKDSKRPLKREIYELEHLLCDAEIEHRFLVNENYIQIILPNKHIFTSKSYSEFNRNTIEYENGQGECYQYLSAKTCLDIIKKLNLMGE